MRAPPAGGLSSRRRFTATTRRRWPGTGSAWGPGTCTWSIWTGPAEGEPCNLAAVRAIVEAVDVPCELGGGIRSEATIRQLLDLGLQRLVIGTLALSQPDWFRRMCRQFPGRLALGIDARDGRVATEGWLATSHVAATDLARQFAAEPMAAVIYTDIAADGMLAGPNLAAMAQMQAAVDRPVIASGRRDHAAGRCPPGRRFPWPAASSAGRCTKEP